MCHDHASGYAGHARSRFHDWRVSGLSGRPETGSRFWWWRARLTTGRNRATYPAKSRSSNANHVGDLPGTGGRDTFLNGVDKTPGKPDRLPESFGDLTLRPYGISSYFDPTVTGFWSPIPYLSIVRVFML